MPDRHKVWQPQRPNSHTVIDIVTKFILRIILCEFMKYVLDAQKIVQKVVVKNLTSLLHKIGKKSDC